MRGKVTARDLLAASASHLIPALQEVGFQRVGKGPIFVKRYQEVLHVVALHASKWGGSFYVVVTAWVPELAYPTRVTKASLYEHLLATQVGGRLSLIAVNFLDFAWGAETADELALSALEATESLRRVAFPWFASMATRGDLLRGIDAATESQLSSEPSMKAALLSPAEEFADLGLPDPDEKTVPA